MLDIVRHVVSRVAEPEKKWLYRMGVRFHLPIQMLDYLLVGQGGVSFKHPTPVRIRNPVPNNRGVSAQAYTLSKP